ASACKGQGLRRRRRPSLRENAENAPHVGERLLAACGIVRGVSLTRRSHILLDRLRLGRGQVADLLLGPRHAPRGRLAVHGREVRFDPGLPRRGGGAQAFSEGDVGLVDFVGARASVGRRGPHDERSGARCNRKGNPHFQISVQGAALFGRSLDSDYDPNTADRQTPFLFHRGTSRSPCASGSAFSRWRISMTVSSYFSDFGWSMSPNVPLWTKEKWELSNEFSIIRSAEHFHNSSNWWMRRKAGSRSCGRSGMSISGSPRQTQT